MSEEINGLETQQSLFKNKEYIGEGKIRNL